MVKKQPKRKNGFQKGMHKIGGRKKGTPNRIPALLKEWTVDGIVKKGEALREQYFMLQARVDRLRAKYRKTRSTRSRVRLGAALRQLYELYQYADGSPQSAMLWFANKETAAYLGLVGKILPMQIEGKVEVDMEQVYETPEEIEEEFKQLGLPVPPRLIELNPQDRPVDRKVH